MVPPNYVKIFVCEISTVINNKKWRLSLSVTARTFIVGFEPRFLCSVVNTSVYLICILPLCCASFIIRSVETLQSCLKDAPFCRLLITFL